MGVEPATEAAPRGSLWLPGVRLHSRDLCHVPRLSSDVSAIGGNSAGLATIPRLSS